MSNEYVDPAGNTEAFKAFAQAPAETAGKSRAPLVIGGVVAAALLVLVVYLLVS
jgi:hypothetical protein